jgi:hypothetical protein
MTPLQQLWSAWSIEAAEHGAVTISRAVFAASGLETAGDFDARLAALLQAQSFRIKTVFMPEPDGDTLSIRGTSAVHGLEAATVTVVVSFQGTRAEVSASTILPSGWTFATTFSSLGATALADLSFTDASLTIQPKSDPTTLTFTGTVDMSSGVLSAALAIVTLADNQSPVVLTGPVIMTPIADQPAFALGASISGATMTLPLENVTVSSPGILISSEGASIPDVSVQLSAKITAGTQTLDIVADLMANGSTLALYAVPQPPIDASSILSTLLGGNNYTLPSPVTDLDFVSLQQFGVTIAVSGTPSLVSLAVMIGTSQTTPIGPLNLSISGLSAWITVLSPLSSPAVLCRVNAQLELDPSLPSLFDVEIVDGANGVTVGGSYPESITIGELASALADITLDDDLASITISDIAANFSTEGGGTEWSFSGTASATDWTVFGYSFDAALTFAVESVNSAVSFSFVGGITIANLSFSVIIDVGASGTAFSSTWQGTATNTLSLSDLLGEFELSLPAGLPSAIDLTLIAAGVAYSANQLTVTATTNDGNVVFISAEAGDALLVELQPVDLSDLPLAGSHLSPSQTLGLNGTTLILTPTPLSANQASQMNASIPSGYPLLPAGGTTATLTFIASLDAGGTTIPFNIPLTSSDNTQALATAAAAPATAGTTVWIPVQQSFGPVTIQQVGVAYQSATQTLFLEVDASIAFGPMSLSVIALGAGLQFGTFIPVFTLGGVGVTYSAPPLTISGTLINLSAPAVTPLDLAGELIVTTGTLGLTAIGYYGDTNGTPAMFVFLDAQDDFGGPPAFFVTGIAAGFGYNTNVTVPSLAQVSSFPFLEVLTNPGALGGPSASPSVVLEKLMQSNPPWVFVSPESIWLAAGLSFTTFGLVKSSAILVVQIGSSLVATLLGTSTATYPQNSQSGNAYASITLDLEASLDPALGIFSINGVLAPSSYVLAPECHLTGGFAYDLWFGTNPYAGDFVLTIGGYNPSFTPPPYYPSVPPVGFSWAFGDPSISVSGAAYLALTPSVFMLGGDLDATYESGPLSAWFDAYADVIIRWAPFWFEAQIGIMIGASYTLDLLVTTMQISLELGCTLELFGPPTGGTVTVYWWVFSFTFTFGETEAASIAASQTTVTWASIEGMLPNSTSAGVALSLQATSGLLSANDGAWIVSPNGFAFTTAAPIPSTSATLNTVAVTMPQTAQPFDVHPLDWSGVTTLHAVTITSDSGVSTPFTVANIQSTNVPAALWGSPPEDNGQPLVPQGSEQLVAAVNGLTLTAPPPQLPTTAGAVDISLLEVNKLPVNGTMPFANTAQEGAAPLNRKVSIVAITSGVVFSPARPAIFADLRAAGFPVTSNGGMEMLGGNAGCLLSAPPLLVKNSIEDAA